MWTGFGMITGGDKGKKVIANFKDKYKDRRNDIMF